MARLKAGTTRIARLKGHQTGLEHCDHCGARLQAGSGGGPHLSPVPRGRVPLCITHRALCIT